MTEYECRNCEAVFSIKIINESEEQSKVAICPFCAEDLDSEEDYFDDEEEEEWK